MVATHKKREQFCLWTPIPLHRALPSQLFREGSSPLEKDHMV